MVQAIINIHKDTNHILNLIKAKYALRTKSEAIDMMAKEYEQELLEPELRPEYIAKIKKIHKEGKFKRIKDVDKYFRDMLKS